MARHTPGQPNLTVVPKTQHNNKDRPKKDKRRQEQETRQQDNKTKRDRAVSFSSLTIVFLLDGLRSVDWSERQLPVIDAYSNQRILLPSSRKTIVKQETET